MNFTANIFYQFITSISPFLLKVASIFSEKIRKYADGQKGIAAKLAEIKAYKNENPQSILVWFHCASLGEFEQGRPLIEAYKKQFPNHKILLTFFSPSGFDIRHDYEFADFVSYLPIDNKNRVREFVQTVDAKICIIVKYEFWVNLINAIRENGTKLIGISVILRENQMMFKPYGRYILNSLNNFDWFFVQNNYTSDLLKNHGFNNVSIAGDTRFDRVFEHTQQIKYSDEIVSFTKNNKVFVVGSAWQSDMDVMIPFINSHSEIKFIVAPHEIDYAKIALWTANIKAKSIKYTDLIKVANSDAKNEAVQTSQVLFLDTMGMLTSVYKYADYVFVGGGFDKGLHNILEAAVFGPPIFFGNKAYKKFQEAIDLIELKTAFAISDDNDFNQVFKEIINNSNQLKHIHEISEKYINDSLGATQKIMKYLENVAINKI